MRQLRCPVNGHRPRPHRRGLPLALAPQHPGPRSTPGPRPRDPGPGPGPGGIGRPAGGLRGGGLAGGGAHARRGRVSPASPHRPPLPRRGHPPPQRWHPGADGVVLPRRHRPLAGHAVEDVGAGRPDRGPVVRLSRPRAVVALLPGQSGALSRTGYQIRIPEQMHLRRPGVLPVDVRDDGARCATTAQRPGPMPVDVRDNSANRPPLLFFLRN